MPDSVFTSLRSFHIRTFVSAGSGITPVNFTINNLQDTNLSVGGIIDQPLGFDQWAQFYTHFEVRANRLKVTVTNNFIPAATAASTTSLICGFYPSNDITTAVTGEDTFFSQPMVKWKCIGPVGCPNKATISNYVSVKKMVSRQIDSINYTGQFPDTPGGTGTGPNIELVWWFFLYNAHETVLGISATCALDMKLYCRFWGRRNFQTSSQ